jgi:uncharacterized protein with NRDE domain
VAIEPGIHGLSNGFLDSPWPKVERGKQLLESILREGNDDSDESGLIESLFDEVLGDATVVTCDELLPDTGIGKDLKRFLSPIFIPGATCRSADYGTRASTVILVHTNGTALFIERKSGPGHKMVGEEWHCWSIYKSDE